MDTVVLELVKAIKDVSPIVWEAALRQNQLFGIGNLIFGVLLVIISLVFMGFIIKMNRDYKTWETAYARYESGESKDYARKSSWAQNKGDAGEWLYWGGFAICIFWGGPVAFYGMMYLLNPVYWTAHLLLSVGGG